MTADVIVRGQRVLVDDQLKPAAVHVKDGKTCKITDYDDVPDGIQVIDAENNVLMGGLVDSHVHVNEPGRTEWEGFYTATRAACAGGVTTVIDMPLNSSPVTTSLAALEAKINILPGKLFVDVGLLGGIIPGNLNEIEPMIEQGGVVGFKSFMIHSGIDDFPHVNENDVRSAMEIMQNLKKRNGRDVVMMFHAELSEPVDRATSELKSNNEDSGDYKTFLKSRPREAENSAIALVIKLVKEYDVHVHIVHLSSSDALTMIQQAQQDGIQITCETTFHYLCLDAEHVPHGNTLFKCCPPIRETDNKEKLWQGLKSDIITMIVSDHSPCTYDLKKGDFMSAWGGISSLELGLSIIWTQARQRQIPLIQLVKWMSDNTSALVHLQQQKGQIKIGRDADFVIWDPDFQFTVDQEKLQIKNKCTPYHGQQLYGKILTTVLRGQIIYKYDINSDQGSFVDKPTGQRLIPK
ncbi:unnamed protein product [Didymodactylos carnosus]|uniref:allantoinase n=1 Tax=Didymodactylos carnosus TaxID=1234261 RepID=A0A814BB10_9BILA|nr:unnamed protein product [Didymodactylos carnosus]CAF0933082.1 unnamed protein product [Didymodactylos carnosus]CAF3705230.1 unnamed protein product [Didymodactylos carnosus]CAF3709092.1 unnamed protein product [Didymodactylos carnosus]